VTDQDASRAANEVPLGRCHHCGVRFGNNEARVLADVIVTGEPVERIAIHELCLADDPLLRYHWENMTVERVKNGEGL
jgi:hypothetical protein